MKKKTFTLLFVPFLSLMSGCVSIAKIATDANIDQWYNTSTGEIEIEEVVDIDWWTWGGLAAEEIFTNIADTFTKEVCPNIRVHYTCLPSSSYLMTLANSSNDLPDLFFMPDTDFYQYAYNGVVWDFSKYVTDEELSDVWEAGYERYMYNPNTKVVGNTSGAGLYALPKDISTFSLCYNEDVMKEACKYISKNMGVTYNNTDKYYNEYLLPTYLNDKNPLTWDKFIELGLLLKPYCEANNKNVLSHYELNPAIFSNNADFLDDANGIIESRIEEPQFAAALDFMHSLAFDYGLMAGANGSNTTTGYSSFVNQSSIFSFFGPWDCENFWGVTSADPDGMGFKVRMVPVPYGPGADGVYDTADDGMSCAQIGSAGYCISNKTTTSNLQRAAALKFCKWLTISEDAQRELYRKGTQLPNLKSMADEYIRFGLGQTTTYNGNPIDVTPSNLSAFIDVVNGSGPNDKVTGRAKTETRILTNEFKSDWSKTVSNIGFWTRADATGAELVAAFKDTLQSRIDEANVALGRNV